MQLISPIHPVFFVQGIYDFVTSYTLARDYLDKIETPQKAFFTFNNVAHAPNLEEPEKFMQTVRQILQMTE